jgi:glyoxylase-like metal-dependent hydrolase (beta-lactamase superfamily II)
MHLLPAATSLEDELGDVLEKALRRKEWSHEDLAAASGVEVAKIRDAIDYRPDLSLGELRGLAAALSLNEVGLCALGVGRYPLPAIEGLAFQVWALRMPHGIGVANAYVVSDHESNCGLLFDTGAGLDALEAAWPPGIEKVSAVFLTHGETEHAGGLCEVVARFGGPPAYVPEGAVTPCGVPAGEGDCFRFGALEVLVFRTPGHASAHNCYWVRPLSVRSGRSLLISGDLIFAGSAGGAYFCHRQMQTQLHRVLECLPSSTVIAPGHGPMTTVENERSYNPFLA